MDYEKKYKEALEWARKVMQGKVGFVLDEVLEKFPELKENEDEKMMNQLHSWMKEFGGAEEYTEKVYQWLKGLIEKQGEKTEPIEGFNTEFERQISHLIASIINNEHEYTKGFVKWTSDALLNYAKHEIEKQGEPKFKVGDWVVYNRDDYSKEIIQVYDIRDDRYYFTDNVHFSWSIKECDEKCHLWDITKDAKYGDVLADDYGIYIFNRFDEYDKRCFLCVGAYQYSQKVYEYERMLCSIDVRPATKEQRNTLERAMNDAGCAFDFNKKELKKIEQNRAENEELTEFDKAVGVSIGTWNPKTPEQIKSVKTVSKKLLKLAKKQINDKYNPAWSEEDEQYLLVCKNALAKYQRTDKWDASIISRWLESLKDRVQPQPKLGDNQMKLLNELMSFLLTDCPKQWAKYGELLKSLKPQNTWKPSDEQMEALNAINVTGGISYAGQGQELINLYNELKKLCRNSYETT